MCLKNFKRHNPFQNNTQAIDKFFKKKFVCGWEDCMTRSECDCP